jgi:hypothetical protein
MISTFRPLPFLTVSLLLASASIGLAAPNPSAPPLPRAHAHNDYEHPQPLLDALDQGFGSVEADIFLVEDQLLVAHDRPKVHPERTLQSLYLDPLRERIRRLHGQVHPGLPTFTLLIDFKSEADPTYRRLRDVLIPYRDVLTSFYPDRTVARAVTIILSGNRPRDLVNAEPERWVAIDGRLPDLQSNPSPHLIPLISDHWRSHFTWNGQGPLPEDQQTRLQLWVQQAHDQGRRIRFWGAADRPEMWETHWSAGVDLINTDRLADLAAFLHSRLPQPTQPTPVTAP